MKKYTKFMKRCALHKTIPEYAMIIAFASLVTPKRLLKEPFLFISVSLHFLLLNSVKPALKNLLTVLRSYFWGS